MSDEQERNNSVFCPKCGATYRETECPECTYGQPQAKPEMERNDYTLCPQCRATYKESEDCPDCKAKPAQAEQDEQGSSQGAKASHTPGPYEIVESEISGEYLIYPTEVDFLDLPPGHFHLGHIAEVHGQNAEANSKLFCRAWLIPEMVEALEKMSCFLAAEESSLSGVQMLQEDFDQRSGVNEANNILAKVREAQG